MKSNFVHVCFVIDESGSMVSSTKDVIDGFKSVIEEQSKNENGTVAISYYKFNDGVTEVYRGVPIKDVKPLEKYDGFTLNLREPLNETYWKTEYEYDPKLHYRPSGLTALFDGVGTAIDNIGEWLSGMDESERPEKNLIVIMTDGGENASIKYKAKEIKEKIKHQEDKYNWSFVYMGSDIVNADDANSIGIKTRAFASRGEYSKNYDIINSTVSCYLNSTESYETKAKMFADVLNVSCDAVTENFAAQNNLNAKDLKAKA